MLGSFFGVQNFRFQYFLVFSVISMHLRVFSEGQGTEWGYFWGLLKFQVFFRVFEIPHSFLE